MQFLRVLICLLGFVAASAHAQARNIPAQANGGALTHLQDMIVSINGVAVRLAPGVQIRDQSNRLIVPSAVPPGSLVKYVLDQNGQVRQVWILRSDEARQPTGTGSN
ncbi:MAG TPA: hypothetical protein VH600_16250 [Burkholderiales bacterium]|jgi:hypothetical protein